VLHMMFFCSIQIGTLSFISQNCKHDVHLQKWGKSANFGIIASIHWLNSLQFSEPRYSYQNNNHDIYFLKKMRKNRQSFLCYPVTRWYVFIPKSPFWFTYFGRPSSRIFLYFWEFGIFRNLAFLGIFCILQLGIILAIGIFYVLLVYMFLVHLMVFWYHFTRNPLVFVSMQGCRFFLVQYTNMGKNIPNYK
jgi:hypothetical protein